MLSVVSSGEGASTKLCGQRERTENKESSDLSDPSFPAPGKTHDTLQFKLCIHRKGVLGTVSKPEGCCEG